MGWCYWNLHIMGTDHRGANATTATSRPAMPLSVCHLHLLMPCSWIGFQCARKFSRCRLNSSVQMVISQLCGLANLLAYLLDASETSHHPVPPIVHDTQD